MSKSKPRRAGAPGLREEQRRERAHRMLGAASALFMEQGYAATSVEAIAERAGVSPATVYNYFETKPNIIMALAERHHEMSLPERDAMVERQWTDAFLAVRSFQGLLFDQSLRLLSRDAWRAIIQASYMEPGGPAQTTAEALNLSIKDHYRRLLTRLSAAGLLRRGIDLDSLAEVIFAVNAINWRRFIVEETMSPQALKRTVDRQVGLVLEGLASPDLTACDPSNDD